MARPGKGFLAPAGVVLIAAAAAYHIARLSPAFVAPPLLSETGRGAALRGAINLPKVRGENRAGSLALGVSAAVLLIKAASFRRALRSQRTVLQAEKTPLEALAVGEKEFTGKVVRDAKIGVYVDIGAEKDALLPRNMVPKDKKYEEGETIEKLKIFELQTGDTPSTRKIRVTLGDLPTSRAEGDKVTGTVRSAVAFGVFVDIGMARDALAPSRFLPENPMAYKQGQELELEVISIEGDKVVVGVPGVSQDTKPTASVTLGQQVTGTVSNANEQYGVFFNIGLQRDALCWKNQLDKDISEYKEGDKVEGLRVAKIDGDKIEVTPRPLASEAKVGQTLDGTVVNIVQNGIIFDAGLSSDVLAPVALLRSGISEYSRGQVADLVVTQVQNEKVIVSDRDLKDVPTSLENLNRGQEVTGKVKKVEPMMGIFMDIGASKDALLRTKGIGARVLPKPIEEYKVGEEVPNLIILRADAASQTLEVVMPDAPLVETSLSMEDLTVGQEVEGTVSGTMAFGVFVDIGAERDALYALSQLENPLESYKSGQKLTGLRVSEVDAVRQRLAVTMRPTAGNLKDKEGTQVKGQVLKVMPFGVFFNIGASADALAPTSLLNSDLGSYKVGEEIELTISKVDVEGNRVTVSEKGAGEGAGATTTIAELEVGSKVKGVVRAVRDYGVFVDINLGRTDALMPNSMLGDVTSAAFQPNQEIEVWIARTDAAANRVTVSYVEPTADMRAQRGARKAGAKSTKESYIPEGFMIPDPKRHVEMLMGREELIDPEPTPWYEWEKKYPGFVKFQEKDQVIVISGAAHGFYGFKELVHSEQVHINIPKHLQKPDAKQPTKEELEIPLEAMPMPNYDSGIKPEIHTKYRQPPMNDPEWRWHDYMGPIKPMKWSLVVDQAGPFVPEEKPGKKKVAASEEGGDES